MAKVIIETAELTLCKVVDACGCSEDANVVSAIVDIVNGYDAAHTYKGYSVREHLLEALKRRE